MLDSDSIQRGGLNDLASLSTRNAGGRPAQPHSRRLLYPSHDSFLAPGSAPTSQYAEIKQTSRRLADDAKKRADQARLVTRQIFSISTRACVQKACPVSPFNALVKPA